ncbi:MAG: esterase [Leptolyngbyaceae cyanobacterium SL_5_9]|nr:esterase [Leptolyngbyaceae cyanobacterium SL_5_9]NJO74696.1 esterase [Leptolyngbyaceae cyanobacterium RM1_406_9]
MDSTDSFIYLHGFASGPRSAKAKYLGDRFQSLNINLQTPDLNQDDFTHLTLSRQIQQIQAAFPPTPQPVTLIGSSFGGLTAAWIGECQAQVKRLVLLAPAFQFLAHWLPKLGKEQVQSWQTEQYLSVYHYGAQQMLPLHYGFVTNAVQYEETKLQRSLPTLILHGRIDEVIPIQASRSFANQRPWVKLVELDSDHALADVQPRIWQEIQTFCQL